MTLYNLLRFALVAALTIGTAILTERSLLNAEQSVIRDQLIADVGTVRADIERMVAADIQIVRALVAYVQTNPELDQEAFNVIAPYLLEGSSGSIRNLALARDLVITQVHPLAGNEDAIGLDYRTSEAQWPMVQEAVYNNRVTMAGPLELVQGGQGLIARFPIFLPGSRPDTDVLWGIASLVIDVDRFLESVGTHQLKEDYAFAIFGETAGRPAETPFYEVAHAAIDDAITFPIAVPGVDWRIVAAPITGWPAVAKSLALITVIAVLFLLAFAYLAWRQYKTEQNLVGQSLDLESARIDADRARQVAEGANRTKTLFLANMSHELRTPLNAIIGFSDVIRHQMLGPVGTPKYLEYLKDINDASTHLLGLLSDILDISRIESGQVDVMVEDVSINDLIARTLPLIGQGTRLSHHRIVTDIAADLPTLSVDERLIRQVLLNLIGNAIKYTPQSSLITIRARVAGSARQGEDQGASIILSVEDNGLGLPQMIGEKILEPFVRGSDTLYTGTDGAGLGLAIAVRIMHLHGGRLSIDETYRHGAKIDLIFPETQVRCDDPPQPRPA